MKASYDKDTPPELLPAFIYSASKVQQERAFFNWAKENKAHFAVNSVLPNMNVSCSPVASVRDLH